MTPSVQRRASSEQRTKRFTAIIFRAGPTAGVKHVRSVLKFDGRREQNAIASNRFCLELIVRAGQG
jgi:hypothetical protein